MKKLSECAGRAFAGLVALGIVMAAARAGAEAIPQVVQVVKVEGNAQYSTDGRTWMTLHEGTVLKPGCTIRTAEKSLVDVMLGQEGSAGGNMSGPYLLNMPGGGGGAGAGGGGGGGGGGSEEQKANIVRIFESTVLGVDKLTLERTGVDEVSDTQLDLKAGQIMANVKKLSAQSRYEIKLPNGVAGIRGATPVISSSLKSAMLFGSMNISKVATDGSVRIITLHEKEMYDPGSDQVSQMTPQMIADFMKIYDDMQPAGGIGPTTCYTDRSNKNPCPIDGTSL